MIDKIIIWLITTPVLIIVYIVVLIQYIIEKFMRKMTYKEADERIEDLRELFKSERESKEEQIKELQKKIDFIYKYLKVQEYSEEGLKKICKSK